MTVSSDAFGISVCRFEALHRTGQECEEKSVHDPRTWRRTTPFRRATLAHIRLALSPPLLGSPIPHHALPEIFSQRSEHFHGTATHDDDVGTGGWSIVGRPADFEHAPSLDYEVEKPVTQDAPPTRLSISITRVTVVGKSLYSYADQDEE